MVAAGSGGAEVRREREEEEEKGEGEVYWESLTGSREAGRRRGRLQGERGVNVSGLVWEVGARKLRVCVLRPPRRRRSGSAGRTDGVPAGRAVSARDTLRAGLDRAVPDPLGVSRVSEVAPGNNLSVRVEVCSQILLPGSSGRSSPCLPAPSPAGSAAGPGVGVKSPSSNSRVI